MLRAARHRLSGEDHGVSLVELLVVMLLMTIVGGIVATSLVLGMQKSAAARARVDEVAAMERSLEAISRELRAACPLQTADPLKAVAVIDRGTEQLRFTYAVSGGELTELRERRSGGSWVVLSSRTLLDDVVNTPVFTYRDKLQAPTNDPRRAAIATIDVQRDITDGGNVRFSTTVAVRNNGRCT